MRLARRCSRPDRYPVANGRKIQRAIGGSAETRDDRHSLGELEGIVCQPKDVVVPPMLDRDPRSRQRSGFGVPIARPAQPRKSGSIDLCHITVESNDLVDHSTWLIVTLNHYLWYRFLLVMSRP